MHSPGQRSATTTNARNPEPGADRRGLLNLLRSVKRADGTVRLSHGQRGVITHGLRVAAERFRDNARDIRATIDRELSGQGIPSSRLITYQELAETMERQAREAADAAELFEDCANAEVTLSEAQLGEPETVGAGGGK
ncbi:MAG: hypothetical protein IT435_20645 [Phycisphaerales bacterium]|nr:hypothetical protein [Phycisphaerales bacterium]